MKDNLREEIRTLIVKHTSEMLDNPDEHSIYPTTKFYNNLEKDFLALIDDYTVKAYKKGVEDEIECVERSGGHLDLDDKN